MEDPRPQALEVASDEAGRRLDVFLAERLGLSRAASRRLLARGAVRIDGRALAAHAKGLALRAGECVLVADTTPPAEQRVVAEPERALVLLAEGPGWCIADKPAGMPVHPLEPGERGSLLGALIARVPGLHGVGEGGLRSGVVHRLDVDTSGALLVATEEASWQRLRAAFQQHRVGKVYRALASGRVDADGQIELPLVTGRHRPARVRAARPEELESARRTHSAWRVLERFSDATLLEVRTTTGFLHQVRATLAHLGHPLLGDRIYSTDAAGAPDAAATRAPRHMLHAAELSFEEISAHAPDPPDFAAQLAALRASG